MKTAQTGTCIKFILQNVLHFSPKCCICSSDGGEKDSMTSRSLWMTCVMGWQGAKLPAFQQDVPLDFVKPFFVLIIKSNA